jgi:phosphoglucomutase
MKIHDLAGQPVPIDFLPNIPRLVAAYYTYEAESAISFGTSGHRGSSLDGGFNENHILAICQAVSEVRGENGVSGPMFIGMDTHALSEPALFTALEVFAANNVEIMLQNELGYTPTPVISHAILNYNKKHKSNPADGVVITPSHNPPEDGGFKYNPTHGGPAETELTNQIQKRANQLMGNYPRGIKRIGFQKALHTNTTHSFDFITPYVEDLKNVVNMDAVASAGLKIGVDPMGGSGIAFWEPIADTYHLDLEIVNHRVDPAFSFMRLDRDGKIRMDCSSPYAMAGLIDLKDKFDIAFGNDPDFDRHGIVTKSSGLMNPNHYLAVAIWYLFRHRPDWPESTGIGKTLVSSSMIDRIALDLKRQLFEVPVGFKWFVDGLLNGSYGFAGEESAGASFLRRDGNVWTTDKDGIIMDLLAAEITATTGYDPGEHYKKLENKFGSPVYQRIDSAANAQQRTMLKNLSADSIHTDDLAGEPIKSKISRAPANNAPIGGIKIISENGWFAARPSGTEDVYKIYAESFRGDSHLEQILQQAQDIVQKAFQTSQ